MIGTLGEFRYKSKRVPFHQRQSPQWMLWALLLVWRCSYILPLSMVLMLDITLVSVLELSLG
jgi:hypothetical protein